MSEEKQGLGRSFYMIVALVVIVVLAVFLGPKIVDSNTTNDPPADQSKERILFPKTGPTYVCVDSRLSVTYLKECANHPNSGFRFVSYEVGEESQLKYGREIDIEGRTVIWAYDKQGLAGQDISLTEIRELLANDALARGERAT